MSDKPSFKIVAADVDAITVPQKIEAFLGLYRSWLNREPSQEEINFFTNIAADPGVNFLDALSFTKVGLAVQILQDAEFVNRALAFQKSWSASLEASDAANS